MKEPIAKRTMKDKRREEMKERINNNMDALFCCSRRDFPDADLSEMLSEILQCAADWYSIIDSEESKQRHSNETLNKIFGK